MSKLALSTVATRHQVFLERLKTQTAGDFVRVLPQLEKSIRDVIYSLHVDTLDALSRAQLQRVLGQLERAQAQQITEAKKLLLGDLKGLAGYEVGFEARTLEAAIKTAGLDWGLSSVTANDAYKLALEQPLSATGQLLEPFIDTWGTKQIAGVDAAVTRAWGEGRTIGQLAQEIRGTAGANYKDGLVAASRRQAEAVARTAVQQVAQQARGALWQANTDIVEGRIWVSTMDSHTTTECRALDGEKFPLDSGPWPPLHIGCRSTTIAKLPKELDFLDEGATRSSASGPVPADQSYYEWLSDQPAAFQDEALGAARGTLFRDGGLTADEFKSLSLDRNFQPMTLDQMAAKEPAAFAQAGLDEYIPPGD